MTVYQTKLNLSLILRYLLILLILIPIGYSFNVCNVDVNEIGAFIVKENVTNKDILIVDSQGDMYFEGKDHTQNNINTEKSLVLDSNLLYFNRVTSRFPNFSPSYSGSIPIGNSLVIQTTAGINVASFSTSGIYTKGNGIYETSQAGCMVDGNYCNGAIVENRNNYCHLTGSKIGSCIYNILSSENCASKASTDSDGGQIFTSQGTVVDYTTCGGIEPSTSCQFTSNTDYCSSGTNLIEYYTTGTNVLSSSNNCAAANYNYCDAGNSKYVSFSCSNGACSSGVVSSSTPCSNGCKSTTGLCYTGYWITTNNACTGGTCGQKGTQTPTVSCSNSDCNPLTKPTPTAQVCDMPTCVEWTVGTCTGSSSCGSVNLGTRTVTCPSGNCDPATKPSTSCQVTGTNACTLGAKTCSTGGTSYSTCITSSNGCTIWSSPATSCTSGTACSSGSCISTSCSSQAKSWSGVCSGTVPSGSGPSSVSNSASGYTGSATFSCSPSTNTWTLQSGSSCSISLSAPYLVSAVPINEYDVRLTFNLLTGVQVDGYRAWCTDGFGPSPPQVSGPSNSNTIIITNLIRRGPYNCYVWAYKDNTDGPQSNIRSFSFPVIKYYGTAQYLGIGSGVFNNYASWRGDAGWGFSSSTYPGGDIASMCYNEIKEGCPRTIGASYYSTGFPTGQCDSNTIWYKLSNPRSCWYDIIGAYCTFTAEAYNIPCN